MTPDLTALSATLPAALPSDAVLAHVGMHKTGTTAVQSMLSNLRLELAPHGVTYPGDREGHHLEARALTRGALGWQSAPLPPPEPAVWDEFATAVRENGNRVVFSSEFFSGASPSQIRQMMADLDDRAHVLIGVRNLGQVAVSSWQQTLKQGRVSTLDGWLKGNFQREPGSQEEPFFWARFDPGDAVTRFAQAAGSERVSVIVVRESDRRLLPATFERLLDLPEGLLAGQTVPRSNRGLTSVEAEAVRQVNVALRGRLEWPEYDALVRNGVIRRLVEYRAPKPEERKPELPAWVAEQVAREGDRVAQMISSSGVRVIGDLSDLKAPAAEGNGDQATTEVTSVPLELLVESVVGAVASATYGTWTFDQPRVPKPPRVAETTAVGLLGVVGSRIVQRARRGLQRD